MDKRWDLKFPVLEFSGKARKAAVVWGESYVLLLLNVCLRQARNSTLREAEVKLSKCKESYVHPAMHPAIQVDGVKVRLKEDGNEGG